MSLASFAKQRKAKAPAAAAPFIGLPLGRSVHGGRELWASLEDVGVIFAGPRTGKSTAYAVPFILAAQGPCLVTTNKNDLHHHTRGIRELIGQVFAFDPEEIATKGDQGWWLNPLRGTTTPKKAKALADVFEAAEGGGAAQAAASKGIDFFPERGKTLLRALFLAASVSEGWTMDPHSYTGPAYFLRDVQAWLAAPEAENPVPVQVLDATSYREVLNELVGIYTSAPQERSGVFSTAQLLLSPLTDPQIMDWVNPRPGEEHGPSGDGRGGRTLFDPDRFMQGCNTLYSLSTDGYGSAKALVTALTQSVLDAATEKAKGEPGGRLALPMVCVLDEAANVCPWPQLPKLYSHFGSRGICVWTILQSYAQGVGVWGQHG
ncbi:type IV secretory system conjugative DNA transfer family protein, partial [Sinomonas sp.]|uniref:type IV secretory system conjugative DNA transfer family protein n=1 Tax=Sinomonas sp. TaxID=1914986 RepID=UPI002FE0CA1C